MTEEQWKERAAQSNVRFIEPIINGNTKHKAECLQCGNIWSVLPKELGPERTHCPQCPDRKRPGKRRITQEEWDERAAALNLKWLEPVRAAKYQSRARCLVCGWERMVSANSVQRGLAGCPNCSGKIVSQETWDERAALSRVKWLEPVGNNSTPKKAQCLVCAFEWKPRPSAIQNGQGCPKCAGKRVNQEEWSARAAQVDIELLAPAKTTKPTPARCQKCGHEWKIWVSNLSKRVGCPVCGERGFTPAKPAILYLLL